MKEKFNQIESHLQRFIEEHTARLFSSVDPESKLAESLVQAMQTGTAQQENGDLLAPDLYFIAVHPKYAQDVSANQSLLENLAAELAHSADQSDIKFPAVPTITVIADSLVPQGKFRVWASTEDASLAETQALPHIHIPSDEGGEGFPTKTFLIVGGTRIFSLEEAVINIGRKLDNHLVIDDPRVSRKHAQLRALRGTYMLFDLESSGGTFVNGGRVKQATLHPGDVISLAGVPLVYGQDAVRGLSETQEYTPPSHKVDNGTTHNQEVGEFDLDNFEN